MPRQSSLSFSGAQRLRPLSLVLAALFTGPALAQSSPQAPAGERLWEVGVASFGLSQQAWPGASEDVRRAIALPYVLYRGPMLRIDREAFGMRAVKTPNFELDVGFSGALGSRAKDTVARQGMPELGTLVEFGPRARWNLAGDSLGSQWRLELPLRGVFDVNDGFSSRGLAVEPKLRWTHPAIAGWRLNASAGALFGDRQLTSTFYDVELPYATATRPAYDAKPGLIAWRLRLTASHRLSPDWRIFGFGRIDSVAGAANLDSPLVSRTVGYSAGVGLQWTWIRAERPAAD